MPRVYASDNDPLDFCRRCYPLEREAEELYGRCGDGPDGRGNCFGFDAEHPPYEGEDYICQRCGARLRAKDD